MVVSTWLHNKHIQYEHVVGDDDEATDTADAASAADTMPV